MTGTSSQTRTAPAEQGARTGRVEVMLFDADGVLQLPGGSWRTDLAALAGTDDPQEQERFVREVGEAELGTMTGAVAFAEPLAEVLRRWGTPASVHETLAIWRVITVDAAVLARVHRLVEQGVRCAVATNQHRERAAYMRAELTYHESFEEIFASCEIGLAKPDPAFFTHACDRMGVAPAHVLFVDDMEENVAGARKAGLSAEVFEHGGGVAELDRILALHGLA